MGWNPHSAFISYGLFTVGFAVVHTLGAWAMTRWSARWRCVQPRHKTFYVAANVTKAAVLLGMMCVSAWWCAAWDVLHTADWNRHGAAIDVVRWSAIVYAATDASQFLTVKLDSAGAAHHLMTSLFGVYVCVAATIHPLAQALLWFGFCSVTAFLANAYVGIRVLYGPNKFMEDLRRVAHWTYMLELALNLPYHTYLTFRAAATCHVAAVAGYVLLTYVLVTADIKMMVFLATPGGPSKTETLLRSGPVPPLTYDPPHGLTVARRWLVPPQVSPPLSNK